MDSQCHASNLLEAREPRHSLFEILTSDKYVSIEDCIYLTEFQQNLYCMPNVPDTASLEPALMKNGTKEGFNFLHKGLRNYALALFDITLIDNPPNTGIVVINSLHCSDFAILPTEAGSTHSIRALIKAVQFIQDIGTDPEGNAGLRFLGLLLKKVDRRSSVSWIITEQLKAQFGEHMFEIAIPINTSIQRAELMDQTIFTYDFNSVAAKAYQELARELISILEKQK